MFNTIYNINIIDKIANIEINDNPVETDKITTFEISNEYLVLFFHQCIDFEYL